MTTTDRDPLIRTAIAPDADAKAPFDLGDEIYRAVLVTPQRRPGLRLGPLRLPAPAAGVLLAILARPPALPQQLAMYHGGPDRTGVMPGPGPDGEPTIAWDVKRGGGVQFGVMPLVAGGRVYVADDSGMLAALDEATGDVRWTVDAGSPIHGTPVLVDDLVIAGTDAGTLTAVRVGDGGLAWQSTVHGTISASLLALDGVLYVGSEDGNLYARDVATGAPRWSLPGGGPITRGPAIARGVLYVGATGGRFSAIDLGTHAALWSTELGPGAVGTPTIGSGRVYVGRGLLASGPPHDLVALDARTGDILWHFASPAGRQVHMGGLAEGVVYAVSEDDNVYAISADTGAQLWEARTKGSIGTLAAIVGKTVYVTSADRTVRALSADNGAELWQLNVVGTPTTPAVIDGRVFVGTNLGRVIAIAGSGSPAASGH
jgi:eukaryotic-like serine/threonine-protein kinase